MENRGRLSGAERAAISRSKVASWDTRNVTRNAQPVSEVPLLEPLKAVRARMLTPAQEAFERKRKAKDDEFEAKYRKDYGIKDKSPEPQQVHPYKGYVGSIGYGVTGME